MLQETFIDKSGSASETVLTHVAGNQFLGLRLSATHDCHREVESPPTSRAQSVNTGRRNTEAVSV